MSTRPATQTLPTLTVLKCYPAANPEGRIALVFETKEQGTIGFEITLMGVKAVQKALAQIEQFLLQKPGQA